MRSWKGLVFGAALLAAGTLLASVLTGLPAVVQKKSVTAFSKPDFGAASVGTLHHGDAVRVANQDGLWYQIALANGATGFVRVNEIRIAQGSATGSADTMQILLTGKSGQGRVTETAGVRGLNESDLQSAAFDPVQLAKMQSYRATPESASAYAASHGWASTTIPWPGEAPPKGGSVSKSAVHSVTSAVGGLLGGVFGSAAKVADQATPESEAEQLQTELDLGPLIAGRVLGARPLWDNPQAQTRVNVIGRWLASQTSRPELPWTFGIIDDPEYNAFAAPGGYILVTRGLYEIVANDEELASVLAHEITHVVQRDQYNVIRKQGLLSAGLQAASEQVNTGGGVAENLARDYVEKNGAGILLTKLDRDAEYRADAIGEVYLARAGMNPLAMYAMLQKMAATGTANGKLEELYATHPTIADRLNRIDERGYGALTPYLERPVPQ
ncbi:MAG TPA: M48 family metalloprotease [Gammaproteobacteria bacterium]|nr:M48 family metalloprotease [Gammaproteobacteria bacterium]